MICAAARFELGSSFESREKSQKNIDFRLCTLSEEDRHGPLAELF